MTTIWIDLTKKTKSTFMLYGYNGRGKTHMLGTILPLLGEQEEMVLLDFRGNYKTILSMYRGKNSDIIKKKLNVCQPRSMDEIDNVYGQIEEGVDKGIVKWIGVDTVTDMQKVIMFDLRSEKVSKKGGNAIIKLSGKPTYDDWYQNQDFLYNFVGKLKDLEDVNIVFTALAEDKTPPTRPSLDTKIAEKVIGMCDVILYLDSKQVQGKDKPTYVCYSRPSNTFSNFLARDCNDLLDATMEPDFGYIMRLIG